MLLQHIGNEAVQKFYPKLNEHNQDHAHLLVEGSNIDF
jgi:hypothetical protein